MRRRSYSKRFSRRRRRRPLYARVSRGGFRF